MTAENALSAVGLLGLGGLMGTYLQLIWQRRNAALLQQQEFKDARFKCIIMLMYTVLDFEKRARGLEKFGRDFRSREEILDELKAEWHNAILFASEDALQSIHGFIRSPSVASFKRAALDMRKDLWGGKSSEALGQLEF